MKNIELLKAQIELTISPMDYMAYKKQNPEGSILIDVRNAPAHIKKEKIQGAIEISLNELENKVLQLPKDKTIIVYCWDVWCNMAKKSCIILLENGFEVKEMIGGISAWKSLNLPTERLEDK